jgi:hypothetical protein
MDQSQEKILTEIKTLEKKFKAGNKRKINNGLLAGVGTAIAGGCILAAPVLAPGMIVSTIVMANFTTLALSDAVFSLAVGVGGYGLTDGKKETRFQLNKAFQRRINRHLSMVAETENRNKIDFIFNIESSVYPVYQKIDTTKVPSVNEDTVLPINMAGYYVKIGNIFTDFF